MNQTQIQNARVLTPDIVDTLKKRRWRDACTALLQCTSCGKHNITGPIVAFFSFRGADLQCYFCQKVSQAQKVVPVPLPADKVVKTQTQNKVVKEKYNASQNFRAWEENGITEKQTNLLKSLIIEKIENEEIREAELNGIQQLSKVEASEAIARLINNAF